MSTPRRTENMVLEVGGLIVAAAGCFVGFWLLCSAVGALAHWVRP